MSDSKTLGLDIQLIADDLPFHLAPDALRPRLASLIRRYVHAPSTQLAETVVHHIEALYLHPALRDAADQQVALRHCARHWRWLAGHCGAASGTPAAAP
jgi:hypothetical protein